MIIRAGTVNGSRSRTPSFYVRLPFLLVGALIIPFQAWWLADSIRHPGPDNVDSPQVWYQSERVRAGAEELYRRMPGFGPDVMGGSGSTGYPMDNSPYLPPLASVVALLPRTELVTFQRAWFLVVAFSFWAFAALLARIARGRWSVGGFFFWHGLVVLMPGALLFFLLFNIDPLLWVFFAGAIAYPRFRGAGLVLTTAVKPYAVWAVIAAVWRERWRVVRGAVWAAVGVVLVSVAALGPARLFRVSQQWFTAIPPALGQGAFLSTNWSLSFLVLRVARWTGVSHYESGPLSPGWRVWLTAASVAAPFGAWWLTRRWDTRLHLTAVLLASLLFSPLCWNGYLAIGLVFAAVLVGRKKGRATGGGSAAAAEAAVGATASASAGP